MAVSLAFAFEQLERFASWPGTPKNPKDLDARIRCLAEVSKDEKHCLAIADQLLVDCEFFPLPKQIKTTGVMLSGLDPSDFSSLSIRCPDCKDNGHVMTKGGAVRCHHPKASGFNLSLSSKEPHGEIEVCRIHQFRRNGICDHCCGDGMVSGVVCKVCRGDGKFITAEAFRSSGKCDICRGTGHTSKGLMCLKCRGSGSFRRVGGIGEV